MAGGAGSTQLPSRLARVLPADVAEVAKTIGPPGAQDVFVTSADDISGIATSRELAQRLTLFDN
jgi:hypothetical protein